MFHQKDKSGKDIFQNGTAFKAFALIEEPNLKSRDYMEDQSFVQDCFLENCPKSCLFGVFDGHGGGEVSQYLVKNLPSIIKENYGKNKKKIKTMFQESFEIADKKILEMEMQAGSTASIGMITLEEAKRVLYIAHVGDSSAYIFDDNTAEKLTPEHRGDNKSESLRVKQAGGKILMGRLNGLLAVTRAFGDHNLKYKASGLIVRPEVKKVEIRLSHRFIVMASDGLWDFVDIKLVQKFMKEQLEVDEIARKLIKLALSNNSGDNISVIVIRL